MLVEDKKKINYLVLITILFLALFSNIRYQTNFAVIRLFDILTILFAIYIFIKDHNKIKLISGLTYLLPFFFIHIILSLNINFNNFLREFSQIFIIVLFLYILIKSKNEINYKDLLKNLLWVFISILSFVIIWHLNKGISVGWKLLPDTRIVYSIITILFFIYSKIYFKNFDFKFYIFLIILFSILLFSGERKAIAIFIFLFSLSYFRGLGIKSIIILFVIYLIFSLSVNKISNPYIQDKVQTTLNIMNTGNFNYVLETGKISEGDTWSNVQRNFSLEISKELILRNLLLGIGTNKYVIIVEDDYSYLPDQMKEGIHGEFQRVIVENGIIGFLLYLFIWVKSWIRFKLELNKSVHLKFISKEQYQYLIYSIYLPIIFYVGTEASSTRSFILLGLISILPDIISTINQNRNIKKNENL